VSTSGHLDFRGSASPVLPLFVLLDFCEFPCSKGFVMSLSQEVRTLETKLLDIQCSGRPFVEIAKLLGVKLSHGRFSEAMTGKKQFDRETLYKLLGIVSRMSDLQKEIAVPINWAQADKIADVLTMRQLNEIDHELTGSDVFYAAAKHATKSLSSRP
jgi:hypothetical protein